MKTFKQFISEALNREQKNSLGILFNNTPSYAAKELSKHVIPDDKTHIHIPITHNTKSSVKDHLEKHGYELSDYSSGKAKDKYGREVNIGSVLKSDKTKAPDSLIKGFENDDRKSKISSDTHHIIFSHDPEHIGECSTNKKWKSCAALTPKGRPTSYGGGEAAKKLADSIREGSHIAYLTKKDEPDAENADARILLHPYHNKDSDGNIQHSVLMPERKVYSKTGGKHSDFHTSLEEFARKNYPMKPGKIYRKSGKVYDDDKQQIRFDTSPESVKKIALSGYKDGVGIRDKEDALSHVQLPHQTIKSIIEHKPESDEHKENHTDSLKFIAQHQKLNDSNFNALKDKNYGINLTYNKHLSSKQVKSLVSHSRSHDNPNLQKVYDNIESSTHYGLITNHSDKLDSNDIHHIIDHHLNTENKHFIEWKTKRNNPDAVMQSGNSVIEPLHRYLNHKLTDEHREKIKKSHHVMSPEITGEDYEDWKKRISNESK